MSAPYCCTNCVSSEIFGMAVTVSNYKLSTDLVSSQRRCSYNNGQKLETVTSFKHLGSVITDKGYKPEILSRIAPTTAPLTRLKPVWIDKSISLSYKTRLTRSLVTAIFLYACESRTLTAEL